MDGRNPGEGGEGVGGEWGINLTQSLCDDSEVSEIVLSSVQFVLITFDPGSNQVGSAHGR